ncbi:MAG: hypothetical protein J5823_02495 [Paludibacteraceae bacterium]|nr:hypothetical protein [Paludibacteraceae bacterium]
MKKLLLSFTMLLTVSFCMAQTNSDARVVQDIVVSVSANVELSASQTEQLTLTATRYVEAIKSANVQYVDDVDALIKAKASAWQDYTMQLRAILTDNQYQTLQQKQQQLKQAIMNQTKGGTKR